jgi:N-acetylglucosaminyl-diphospho-decaprenol L-rhamnosyltransferase
MAEENGLLAAVITVTYNSSGQMASWLEAIEQLGVRDRLELCVVDSGSDLAERRALREKVAPHVDHLLFEPNRGFGRSCNAGVAATSAPVLIFANPDTRLLNLPTALNGSWPDGLAVGGVNHSSDPPEPNAFRHVPTAGWQAMDMLLGRLSPPVYERASEGAEWLSGSALAVSRADFVRAGEFSDEIFLYFEDLDFCLEHRRRGGRILVDDDWALEHPGGAGTPERGDSMDAVARLSGRIFVRHHQGPARAALLYLILVAFYVPRRATGILLRRARGGDASLSVARLVLDLLRPSRVMRRLGAAR